MKKFIALVLSLLMIFSCFGVVGSAAEEGEGQFSLDELLAQMGFNEGIDFSFDPSAFKDALTVQDLVNLGFINEDTISQLPEDVTVEDLITENIITVDSLNQFLKDVDIAALIKSGYLDLDFAGINLDKFFNSNEPIYWSQIDGLDRDTLLILKGNMNVYFSECFEALINGHYNSADFCTPENAVKIANIIGKIINPNFTPVYFTNYEGLLSCGHNYFSYNNSYKFYSAIAEFSGLTDLIDANWVSQKYDVNYLPVLYAVGFNFDDEAMIGNSKISTAERVAPILVKSIIKNMYDKGPLEYILSTAAKLSATYTYACQKPLMALFNAYVATGIIPEADFDNISAIFNIISNGGNIDDNTNLQYFEAPMHRFASCLSYNPGEKEARVDTTEVFLYTMIYTSFLGQYKDNANAIECMKAKLAGVDKLSDDQKNAINTFLDAMFLGDMLSMTGTLMNIFTSNIIATPGNIMESIMGFFTYFWSAIADIFNRIFDSLLNFGKF